MADSRGNIAQFNSPVDTLDTSKASQAANELSSSARMEGSLYRQAGEDIKQGAATLGNAVEQHEYMTEVSQGAAAGAALFNNTTAAWNKVASQPGAGNDKNLQQNFLDNTLEPALQQYQNAFSTQQGQKWALDQVDHMRSHFYDKTSADMSSLAGEARLQDAKTALNQFGAAVYRDPTSADGAMTQFSSYVEELRKDSLFTTPEGSAKLDVFKNDGLNEISKVQIKSYADNINDPQGPAKAKALLESGAHDKYIPPDEQAGLQKYIQEQVRQRRAQQDVNFLQQERAQKMQQQEITTNLFNRSYDKDTGVFTFKKEDVAAIMANTNIPAETKLNIEGAVKKIASDSAIDDPATIRNNAARLSSTSTNPLTQDDLLSQMAQGKLDPSSYSFFNERLKQTPDAVAEKGALSNALTQVQKTILVAPAPGLPPSAEQRQNEVAFTNWFMPAYTSALQSPEFAGMPRAQASQILLSSTNPKGLLTPEKLTQFMTSPQQQLQNGMKNIGPLPSGITAPAVSIPGSGGPSANQTLADKAEATKYNKTTKQYIYLIDNKWVGADGKEAR